MSDTNSLREIMTEEAVNNGWLDYCYKRGDNNAQAYPDYRDWLNSLSVKDFLYAYNRGREAERRYEELG